MSLWALLQIDTATELGVICKMNMPWVPCLVLIIGENVSAVVRVLVLRPEPWLALALASLCLASRSVHVPKERSRFFGRGLARLVKGPLNLVGLARAPIHPKAASWMPTALMDAGTRQRHCRYCSQDRSIWRAWLRGWAQTCTAWGAHQRKKRAFQC